MFRNQLLNEDFCFSFPDILFGVTGRRKREKFVAERAWRNMECRVQGSVSYDQKKQAKVSEI